MPADWQFGGTLASKFAKRLAYCRFRGFEKICIILDCENMMPSGRLDGMCKLLNNPNCPACDSRYVGYIQNVIGRRTGNTFRQYTCLDCLTFFHKSSYKETDLQKKYDFEFLLGQRESHEKIQSQLFLELKTRAPHIKTCCEIGHGLGLFLKAARDYGCESYGFEINPACHEFAVRELGLAVELGLFGEGHTKTYDLIASIMVFEHLERPRELFLTMKSKLNADGKIYLSVPFCHRNEWPFLWTAGTAPANNPPDIFYDNDVHITHFSVEGMCKMGLSLGARNADYFVSHDTAHLSPGAYHGVLFSF